MYDIFFYEPRQRSLKGVTETEWVANNIETTARATPSQKKIQFLEEIARDNKLTNYIADYFPLLRKFLS